MEFIKGISKLLVAEAYSVDYEGSDAGENGKKTHRYRISHTDPSSKEKSCVGNCRYDHATGQITGNLHGKEANLKANMNSEPLQKDDYHGKIARDIVNHHNANLAESAPTIKKPFSKLDALIERVNENGDHEFQTFRGWVKAVKTVAPNAQIEGDKDIAFAKGVGEWDGAKGIIFSPELRAKFATKDGPVDEPTGIDSNPQVVDVPQLAERTLTADETDRKEHIVKSMKKNKKDFEERYGDRAKEVMYATATKMAKESIEPTEENILNEARAVFTADFIQGLKQHPMVAKVVDPHFTANGSSALVRLKDGNAYEVNVTPAHMGQYHQKFTKPSQYGDRKQKARAKNGWGDVFDNSKLPQLLRRQAD